MKYMMILFIHSIACIIFTFLYQLFLKRSFTETKGSFYLFLFLLCFFVPFIGVIISFLLVYTLHKAHTAPYQHAEIVEPTLNLEEIIPFHPTYGAGGVTRQLLNPKEVATKRTHALFKLNNIALSHVNQLFYNLLPDQSDEMRLLAFNILEGQEEAITKRIQHLSSILKTKKLSSKAHAKVEKDLAKQYWDLLYYDLIPPELKATHLEKAMSLALTSAKVLTHDSSVWILLGKIYKYSKRYNDAKHAFNKAASLGASPIHIYPYLAEINFISHDYLSVQHDLNTSKALLDLPQIAPVKLFWDSH